MNHQPGLRRALRLALHTTALLAIVAASTAVLVAPELVQEPVRANARVPLSMLTLGHG